VGEQPLFEIDPILFENYRKSVDLSTLPRSFIKWYDNASAAERLEWFAGRFRCLKYHLYLSGFVEAPKPGDPNLPKEYVPILGMDFVPDPHNQLFKCFLQKRPGENVVLSDLDQQTKKRMILWPRNHLKTSAVRVDIVQNILNYPNIRILFLTGSDKLAKVQLKTIKKFFENPTKRFKWLFPEFCLWDVRNRRVDEFLEDGSPNPKAWITQPAKMGTTQWFTVPARTSDILVEATFTISTTKSTKAGSHYDIIYVDDLVNETNYRKVDALQKCYDNYIDVCPLLDPVGFMVITGTRYSFGDTYERIQEDAQKEMKEMGRTIWAFHIRDCWSHGCQNCIHTDVYHDYALNITQPPCEMCNCPGFKDRGNKDVLFPQSRTRDGRSLGFTLQILEGERIRVGPEFFANQYENKPIATGSQTFDETLIGRQTLHAVTQLPPPSSSHTFIVGDLAYVGQAGRDYSVLFVCRLFQGQIFIVGCEYGTWDSAQVAINIVNLLLIERPNVVYLEKFNGWEAYNNVILAHANSRGLLKVPIEWVKGSQADNAKLIRIGTVKGPLDQKRLWIYKSIKGYDILVQQLVKWPKLGRHDDFADCAGMVVTVPTGYQLENPPQAVSIGSWLRKLNEVHVEDDNYYDNGMGSGFCCSWVMFVTLLSIGRGLFHCLFM
jgi:hypothetical protein